MWWFDFSIDSEYLEVTCVTVVEAAEYGIDYENIYDRYIR